MAYISQNIIDEIRDKADIVEILSSYIPLKRAGRNFKALCPFHHEKTPSFMISPDKQIFHCFGCGEGGNVFNFVMKYERLNFRETLEVIAKKAGYNIPADTAEHKEKSLINKLFDVNELAASFFHFNLLKGGSAVVARDYLNQRAVNQKAIEEFRLGFSLPGWESFIVFAGKKGFSEQILEKAGLVVKGEKGRYYDRFRNKLMFPITNIQGKVIGFGSRVFNEKSSEPKYINSPETDIYRKRKTLYGLNLAKNHIAKEDAVIITEGYFDVITPYQWGVRNIAGCLGTSFTQEQAHVLKRYTQNVVLLFDADSSGEAATLRGLDILIEEGLSVKIACLPAGYDADKLVREKGIDSFNRVIKNSKNLFDYKLDLLKEKYPVDLIENKVRIAEEILPTIKKIENSVLKSAYIRRLAQEITVPETALLEEMKKIKQAEFSLHKNLKPENVKQQKIPAAEKMLLRLMLEDSAVIDEIEKNLEVLEFEYDLARKIIPLLFEFKARKNIAAAVIDRVPEREAQCFIAGILSEDLVIVDKEKTVKDCIKHIKKNRLTAKLAQLESQIKYVESIKDREKTVFLSMEYQRVLKEKMRLVSFK